jgi:hypothetical protein
MRHILILTATLFASTTFFGQTLVRQEHETVQAFIDRLKPENSVLAHDIIETDVLDSTKRIVIAFFRLERYPLYKTSTPIYTDYSLNSYFVGYLYLPLTSNSYQRLLLDTIPPDGGSGQVISVFFANADKDRGRELVVLCQFDQFHHSFGGTTYETFIYDYSKGKTRYLQALSKRFSGCECDFEDGTRKRAKYKTAQDIRTGLIKMGYKQ